jgi:hypothetical protein
MAKFKSFGEFSNNYEKEGFIDKVSTRYYPLKKLTIKQIKSYYLGYIKKWDKKYGDNLLTDNGIPSQKEQSEDSKLSVFVRERDGGCRLLKLLNNYEYAEWEHSHNGLGNILDVAHVFGKGAYPWMRYDPRNVVVLNRFSHSCLDSGKNPLNGKAISEERRQWVWERIVGKDDWEYLKQRSLNREGK